MGFAKHRTFYIREGWLAKGLNMIKKKPYIFTPANREEAIEELGIGKTMISALRFWMEATGLSKEGRGSSGMIEHQLTSLGEFISQNDPYFEDTNTLWLIHYKLVTQKELATTWHWFFNYFKHKFFDQNSFLVELNKFIKNSLEKEIAKSSLKKDFLCLKNTYLYEKSYSYLDNPEDILSSPLTNLELLVKSANQGFEILSPDFNNLDSELIYYSMLDLEAYVTNQGEQISFNELLIGVNSIANIFVLKRNTLLKHLERLEQKGYLDIQKGFGHNTVTINITDQDQVLYNLYNQNKLEEIKHG